MNDRHVFEFLEIIVHANGAINPQRGSTRRVAEWCLEEGLVSRSLTNGYWYDMTEKGRQWFADYADQRRLG